MQTNLNNDNDVPMHVLSCYFIIIGPSYIAQVKLLSD